MQNLQFRWCTVTEVFPQGQKGSTGSHHIGFVIGLGTEIRVMGLGLGFSLGQDKGSDVVSCDPVDPFDSLSLCILQ